MCAVLDQGTTYDMIVQRMCVLQDQGTTYDMIVQRNGGLLAPSASVSYTVNAGGSLGSGLFATVTSNPIPLTVPCYRTMVH